MLSEYETWLSEGDKDFSNVGMEKNGENRMSWYSDQYRALTGVKEIKPLLIQCWKGRETEWGILWENIIDCSWGYSGRQEMKMTDDAKDIEELRNK